MGDALTDVLDTPDAGPLAIRGGVGSAQIIDGSRPHSLLLELFTDAGIGTMVTP